MQSGSKALKKCLFLLTNNENEVDAIVIAVVTSMPSGFTSLRVLSLKRVDVIVSINCVIEAILFRQAQTMTNRDEIASFFFKEEDDRHYMNLQEHITREQYKHALADIIRVDRSILLSRFALFSEEQEQVCEQLMIDVFLIHSSLSFDQFVVSIIAKMKRITQNSLKRIVDIHVDRFRRIHRALEEEQLRYDIAEDHRERF